MSSLPIADEGITSVVNAFRQQLANYGEIGDVADGASAIWSTWEA